MALYKINSQLTAKRGPMARLQDEMPIASASRVAGNARLSAVGNAVPPILCTRVDCVGDQGMLSNSLPLKETDTAIIVRNANATDRPGGSPAGLLQCPFVAGAVTRCRRTSPAQVTGAIRRYGGADRSPRRPHPRRPVARTAPRSSRSPCRNRRHQCSAGLWFRPFRPYHH